MTELTCNATKRKQFLKRKPTENRFREGARTNQRKKSKKTGRITVSRAPTKTQEGCHPNPGSCPLLATDSRPEPSAAPGPPRPTARTGPAAPRCPGKSPQVRHARQGPLPGPPRSRQTRPRDPPTEKPETNGKPESKQLTGMLTLSQSQPVPISKATPRASSTRSGRRRQLPG